MNSNNFDSEWCDNVATHESNRENSGSDCDDWGVELENNTAHVFKNGYDSLTLRREEPMRKIGDSFRIVIDDYGKNEKNEYLTIGFIPATATPEIGKNIPEYGGWCIYVSPTYRRSILWSNALIATDEEYEKDVIPVVGNGCMIEFTIQRGHCIVSFYNPDSETPYEQLELSFIHREVYGESPERNDPTVSGVMELYPAVGFRWEGASVRFV